MMVVQHSMGEKKSSLLYPYSRARSQTRFISLVSLLKPVYGKVSYLRSVFWVSVVYIVFLIVIDYTTTHYHAKTESTINKPPRATNVA